MKERTRKQILEAARMLFVRQGYNATTMINVAREAGKGRRTLYYYFPNKRLLLRSVVEEELNRILTVLEAIVEKDIPADQKMLDFITHRLNNVRHSVFRNGSLRADFMRYMRTIDSMRNRSEKREIRFIEQILMQGIHEGTFRVENVHFMATIIHYTTKGLENPYIRGELGGESSYQLLERTARRIIYGALK
jgi:AcrR family transcriptional regulator